MARTKQQSNTQKNRKTASANVAMSSDGDVERIGLRDRVFSAGKRQKTSYPTGYVHNYEYSSLSNCWNPHV